MIQSDQFIFIVGSHGLSCYHPKKVTSRIARNMNFYIRSARSGFLKHPPRHSRGVVSAQVGREQEEKRIQQWNVPTMDDNKKQQTIRNIMKKEMWQHQEPTYFDVDGMVSASGWCCTKSRQLPLQIFQDGRIILQATWMINWQHRVKGSRLFKTVAIKQQEIIYNLIKQQSFAFNLQKKKTHNMFSLNREFVSIVWQKFTSRNIKETTNTTLTHLARAVRGRLDLHHDLWEQRALFGSHVKRRRHKGRCIGY